VSYTERNATSDRVSDDGERKRKHAVKIKHDHIGVFYVAQK